MAVNLIGSTPVVRLFTVFASLLAGATLVPAAPKPLEVYFIDVEGGQATLFVTPAGQSLLIDTGWGYNAYRDANRIVAAAKLAKVKKLDYVLITHYHADHVGGVPQLIAKIPVGTFIEHGPNREDTNATNHLVEEYKTASASVPHITAVPGEPLPIKGIDAIAVSADGKLLPNALPGAGEPNKACEGVERKKDDPSENARSLGSVFTYGRFKLVDLGDLTWNKELELMCPNNKLGHADLLVVSHHGLDQSNSPALIHGLQPRVAVMNNGSKKGGSPSAWDIVKSSPGLQDLWQLHFSDAGGQEHNTSDPFIANVDEADTGYYLKLTAHEDGSFEIFNRRNKFSRSYPPAKAQ
ncbi:MAG: ComEC/Rec2 family competence protein [Bryobacteraceae bacterium]